jgi:periplasmic divalent cation tolerance protein
MDVLRIVFITVPPSKAEKLARAIVENRLCACVNVIAAVKSFYYWKDELKNEAESLLIVKTTQTKIDDLIKFVKKNHPYEVPEIVTLRVAEGLPDYIDWVIEEMGKEVETA